MSKNPNAAEGPYNPGKAAERRDPKADKEIEHSLNAEKETERLQIIMRRKLDISFFLSSNFY